MAITLKDVAAAVGVSISTVSQVLRNAENTWISEATKERVRQTARDLGYRANPAARLLSSRKGHFFAIVIRQFRSMILLEPIRRVTNKAIEAGYTPFVVESIDLPMSHYDNVESLADAVVFIGTDGKEFCARIEQLTSGIATVVATNPINSRFPEFIWEEALGFGLVLDHLLELGHCNIALLGGDRTDRAGNPTRLRQYQDACEQRGMKPLIIVSEVEEDFIHSGQKMARELLATHPEITAVVGRNIEFSVGALSEFQRQGLQVPRDLSLVSYTDDRIAKGVWPPLTALHTPIEKAADLAVETALQMLEGKTVDHGPTVLPVKLIVRESTGPPRNCNLPTDRSVSN
ncbi:MAG: LacI family DNA-binding transcriptional regulator [bacterium]|nr:LacI family DNA-binding transcriptional regulator [bacterium]